MGIHCTTPFAQFHFYEKVAKIVNEETIRALAYLGEQSIVRIRDRSKEESWIDHTGNLRSSIGYAIYQHGKKQIASTFEVVLNGNDGAKEGQVCRSSGKPVRSDIRPGCGGWNELR